MNTLLSRTLRVALMGAVSMMLASCFGGGSSSIDTESIARTTPAAATASKSLSTEKLDNIEGTIGYSMDVDETIFESKAGLTSGLSMNTTDGRITTGDTPVVTVKKNFIGGVDMNFDGRKISLREEEAVANSDDAWFREYGSGATKFSLSLWNAGKGARGALTQNVAGQNYHKIIGYDASDAASTRQRGHIVFGEQSSLDTVADLKRAATFKGYFSASIIPQRVATAAGLTSEAELISGGMDLRANFDTNTIAGVSTTVLRRPAGDIEFKEEVFSVDFKRTTIKNDGAGGVVYTGRLESSYEPINDAEYSGTFYGDKAQETAGVIRGNTTDGKGVIGSDKVVDGFFSAAR